MSGNSPVKRGEVTEVDGAGNRYRVRFPDEDGVVSYWLDGPAAGGGKRKGRGAMFAVGDQVWCMVDWNGEDGCVVQAANNKKDVTPSIAPENDISSYEDGTVAEHDPVTKINRLELNSDGQRYIEVGPTRILITKNEIRFSRAPTIGNVAKPGRRGA